MHLSPELWRDVPAFWVIGLVGIAFGWPLWRRRVAPNPFIGLTVGAAGDRAEIWLPLNALFGRELTLAAGRVIVVTSVLAGIEWRQPRHYIIVAASWVVAEAILLIGRWRRLGDALAGEIEAEVARHDVP